MAAAAIPLIMSGISGLAGLFGGGKQQSVNSNSNTQTNQTGDSWTSSKMTPEMSALQQKLAQLFSGGLMDMYNKDQDLSGYTAGGLKQINSQADIQNKAVANLMASRGLSFSPTSAVTQTMGEQNRLNQNSSFLSSIPLLQRQMKQQSLQGLVSGFSALPTGSTTDSHTFQSGEQKSSMSGTNVQQGNPMGGLFGGLGAGIAPFLGNMWAQKQFPNLFGTPTVDPLKGQSSGQGQGG